MVEPTPTDDNALLIAVIFEDFELDHTPDGWPAVKQMHLSAAATELRKQHSEIERLTGQLASEQDARRDAQTRLIDMQELAAKSGLAHRRAVQEAVREALREAKKACENLPAPDACTGVERSLWDVATMACAEAVGKVGAA